MAHGGPSTGEGFSESDDHVGVGIVFQPVEDGTLYVKRLKEGQPAQRSGLIQLGDCLCEINGIDVFRQPAQNVKRLLLGPAGSTVRLGFHRGTDPRAPLIQVAIQRCMPGQQLVGVGIIFRSDASGALYVRQMQDGGPAAESGQVRVGDCIVEVDAVDVFRKPIATFTNLMLGPPGTIVTLGFKRPTSAMIERVMLRRKAPPAKLASGDSSVVVHDSIIKLRRQLESAKDEQQRLGGMLNDKQNKLKEIERMYERGASSMGGQMNDEAQRFRTFDHWPHSESSHPGVSPSILAADGFHFTPTAQDPDTVICYFCDLQLGDWERADDCKAVHRKLSPNCPLVLGIPCNNVPLWSQAGGGLSSGATAQQRLEDVLARKAGLLQSITALESALEDARRQIADAVQSRRRLEQEAQTLMLIRSNNA
mmetsp:Transcript_46717/g.95542  ORF Transcript_46717/g.95542 Transcript_46717/m.95542 type:complete len:422 (+) Transcript_46717:63-1328(+)|eukprot:CAMPEP_0181292916 /NCGR_PEP_ID=MMETSP1101-20121128/2776_1 /TAXON_ID=46948 /ORGANISM="Rhodomonas abbreviata, Strain Caron Lab Isolate" /LENGTH=421 /DNA_ID=CAMNT_0023397447 /DNA_START=136 /DNA_END=1401 /DNA_ORIENTATION=-